MKNLLRILSTKFCHNRLRFIEDKNDKNTSAHFFTGTLYKMIIIVYMIKFSFVVFWLVVCVLIYYHITW